jgi:hypothetical protein
MIVSGAFCMDYCEMRKFLLCHALSAVFYRRGLRAVAGRVACDRRVGDEPAR